jgi:acyl-CoA synthetase (AMP-forming)/AMP-acid ligase II
MFWKSSASMDSAMRDILSNTINSAGNLTSVIDNGNRYSYAELSVDVSRFADKVDVFDGSYIIMDALRSYTSIALYVYSLLHNCTLVPISNNIDRNSLQRLADELPVKFFYSDNSQSPVIEFAREMHIPVAVSTLGEELSQAQVQGTSLTHENFQNSEDNPIYLIFTSGTTGNPKGVLVHGHNLLAYMQGTQAAFKFNQQDVFGHISPLTFDFSIHEIFLALYNQAAIAVLRENDKFNIAGFIQDCAVSVWSSVPSTISYLHKTSKLNTDEYPSLRLAFIGGEPVSVSLLEQLAVAAQQCNIYSYYGPTECTVAMMAYPFSPGKIDERFMPLGIPFGDHKMLIMDGDSGELDEYGQGHGYIAGPQVLEQYWHNPQLSRERFFHHDQYGPLFKTGDIISREKGEVYKFITRDDDDIKVGGYRFDTAACREYVFNVSGADAVIVTPMKRKGEDSYSKLVVFTENSQIPETRIAKLFRDNYDNYIQPKFVDVEKFPITTNGKVDKASLMEMVMPHE